MHALSLAGIERFCEALERACGLAYTPEKAYLFEARLAALVRHYGLRDYEALTRLFERDPDARRTSTEALVTAETYFFRDEATILALPGMLADRAPTPARPVTIWSLGCATGQEVWSIIFALALDGREAIEAVRVVGVDLAERALARAREATYTAFELQRGIAPALRDQFFEPAAAGWRVARPWRDLPTWAQANLLGDLAALPRPEVVFCRNVLIYFDDQTKRQVVKRVVERLAPSGLVIFGGAESLLLFQDMLETGPGAPAIGRPRRG